MKSLRALQEAACFSICAAILTWKLILPGFIGMASNGDFGKVIGPLCIDGADHSADNFIFFQSDYVRGKQYCFPAPYFSSDTALAWVASSAQRMIGDLARFDIRWLGAIHILLFLSFYAAVLYLLRPLKTPARIVVSLAALWIFADIGLIAYLNSFFTDAAAILGGLTAAVLALHLSIAERIRVMPIVLFALAALLFVASKAQHGLLGVAAVAFLSWLAWRAPEPSTRWTASTAALVVLSAVVWIVASTPRSYAAQARFNLIFFYFVPNSKTPARDLLELGLDPSDVRYSGLTAFSANTPMHDATWRSAFEAGTSYAGVLMFYLRHPGRVLAKLESDLRNQAPGRRVVNLSNYRRVDGKPAGARDPQVGSWSAIRSALFRRWPGHIVVWLALAVSVPPILAARATSRLPKAVAGAICAVALLAIGEFLSVSLADALETDRHLLLFHVFTDLTIFLALVLSCCAWSGQRP
jgi:hypothetical protein